jgi:hypothetical protein
MNWSTFFNVFLQNIILGILITAIAFGALGYFLVGDEGLQNGAVWGAIFGLVGSLGSASRLISQLFWGGYTSRYGEAQNHPETEEEDSWTS